VLFSTLTLFSLGGRRRRRSWPGRWSGARRAQLLIVSSMLASLVPFGLLFVVPPGTPGYFAAVAAAGALVNGGLPLMIVAAQDLAPHAVGAASGLLMGFTWGTAGLLYVGIGALQEVLGVLPAMALSYATAGPGGAWPD
jgi:MFS transporter, FSR family, fosmidomycin resistance protein